MGEAVVLLPPGSDSPQWGEVGGTLLVGRGRRRLVAALWGSRLFTRSPLTRLRDGCGGCFLTSVVEGPESLLILLWCQLYVEVEYLFNAWWGWKSRLPTHPYWFGNECVPVFSLVFVYTLFILLVWLSPCALSKGSWLFLGLFWYLLLAFLDFWLLRLIVWDTQYEVENKNGNKKTEGTHHSLIFWVLSFLAGLHSCLHLSESTCFFICSVQGFSCSLCE